MKEIEIINNISIDIANLMNILSNFKYQFIPIKPNILILF